MQSAAAGTAERNPTVTALTDGNLLVTWAVPTGAGTAPSELYAQRFTMAGVEVDATPALISATAAHATPVPAGLSSELYPGDPPAEQTVAALAGGAYAIAWVEAANGGEIHVETFGSNGLSSHAPVILDLAIGVSTASHIPERQPDITLLSNGNFLVTWNAVPAVPPKPTQTSDMLAQLFEPDGDPLGSPLVLVFGSDGNGFDFSEISPSITALDNGRFALSWLRLAGNNGDVFIQAFNNDGTRDDDGSINGADVQITANNLTVPSRDPIVTALDDGRLPVELGVPENHLRQQPAGSR